MQREYEISNGTYYEKGTLPEIIKVLNECLLKRRRVHLYYGNTETGEDYLEETDTIGEVGRSSGLIKVPIIVKNSYGPIISTKSLIRIVRILGQEVLYQHPKYHKPEITYRKSQIEGYETEVLIKKAVHARFENEESLKHWQKLID